MNRLVILFLAILLIGCSDDSTDLRPGAARLGAEIAPTTAPAPEIAPTTDDDPPAILVLAAAVAEIAPTTEPKLHQQPQKLHQQHIRVEDPAAAIYGGQGADPTWIAVALLGVFLIVVWSAWIGRAVSRRMENRR